MGVDEKHDSLFLLWVLLLLVSFTELTLTKTEDRISVGGGGDRDTKRSSLYLGFTAAD